MTTLQIDEETTSAILAAVYQYIVGENDYDVQNATSSSIKTNWQNVVPLQLGPNYHQLDLNKISPEFLQRNYD